MQKDKKGCVHNQKQIRRAKEIVSDQEVYKRFAQKGNLDVCPVCAREKIIQERKSQ